MGPQPNGCGKYAGNIVIESRTKLQWGRSRMAAERPAGASDRSPCCRASMGPQPNGCGKLTCFPTMEKSPQSFNGAAAEWLRKEATGCLPCLRCCSLQWGRSRMAAESGSSASRWCPTSCFNGAAAEWLRKGICSRSCGRFSAMLQWGRSRMAAERRGKIWFSPKSDGLQWGRSRMAAERAILKYLGRAAACKLGRERSGIRRKALPGRRGPATRKPSVSARLAARERLGVMSHHLPARLVAFYASVNERRPQTTMAWRSG